MAAGGSIEEEINHSPVDTKTTVVGSQDVCWSSYLCVIGTPSSLLLG